MRGGLGLVEHDPVGRVGAGSVASKTIDAADAAASLSVRSESAAIRNYKSSILQTETAETETVTSESCADHASIRVKHNGAYLSAATTTSTAGGSVERRDDDDSSARLATSKSFRSRHSLSPTSPPPDQVEIAGVASGLSLLGFNDYESEESIISPHDCETNNRHLIIHKAASLVLSAEMSHGTTWTRRWGKWKLLRVCTSPRNLRMPLPSRSRAHQGLQSVWRSRAATPSITAT